MSPAPRIGVSGRFDGRPGDGSAQMAVTEVRPPSTVRWVPVTKEASSERRKPDRPGDLLGCRNPLERSPLLELLTEAGQLEGGAEHRGRPTAPGQTAFDPEPLHGEPLGDRAHDAEHAALRRAVGGEHRSCRRALRSRRSAPPPDPGPPRRKGAAGVCEIMAAARRLMFKVPSQSSSSMKSTDIAPGHPGGVHEAAERPELGGRLRHCRRRWPWSRPRRSPPSDTAPVPSRGRAPRSPRRPGGVRRPRSPPGDRPRRAPGRWPARSPTRPR